MNPLNLLKLEWMKYSPNGTFRIIAALYAGSFALVLVLARQIGRNMTFSSHGASYNPANNTWSPLATNALAGNIWDNFSSQTYKALPSVGKVTLSDPFSGEPYAYALPAGGRGYTRVPSLISLWSTAPFLLNNSVGPADMDHYMDPSVEGRMRVFQLSIEQMLWPEKRQRDSVLGDKVPGIIDRTTDRSQLTLPSGYLPDALKPAESLLHRFLPSLADAQNDIIVGPIPQQTPVGLLSNVMLLSETDDPQARLDHAKRVAELVFTLKHDLEAVPADATDAQLRLVFSNLKQRLLALSKCPDLVVNRGHYFGTSAFNRQDGLTEDEKSFGTEPELSDSDRLALVEFLKTF